MPKYRVLVTREATEHTHIDMEAEDEMDAEHRAVEFARSNPHVVWTVDEGNDHDPYICDPGNCAEEIEEFEEDGEDTITLIHAVTGKEEKVSKQSIINFLTNEADTPEDIEMIRNFFNPPRKP